MNRIALGACSAALVTGLASIATAQVRVIYSNIASSPTSDVPTMPGVKFRTGTTTQFDRPYLSPDGSRWVFKSFNTLGTAADEMVVAGSGTAFANASAVIAAQEGSATPWDTSITFGTINTYMGITNAGLIAFSADTSAATTMDQVVVSGAVGSLALVAREGDAAPGQAAGVGYGSATDAVHILNDGTVCFRAATLAGATTQQVLYRGASIVAQTDLTAPTGQLVAPDQTIDNLSAGRYETDPSGAHSIYGADLNGPTATDLVVVVDGAVVAQEGQILAGSGYGSVITSLSGDAGSQHTNTAGDYIFRGANADGQDWVYKNGVVVAQTDAPITTSPGETESFDDATFAAEFFVSAMNANGDYVIGGTTNNPDLARNAVLVLNGARVIAREGDPVDLNGNGIDDDDAYLSIFNNDDCVLSAGLVYYFFADLRDGTGTTLGQAFLSIDLNATPCPADLGSTGGVPGADGHLDNNDFIVFIDLFFSQDPLADRGVTGGVPGSDGAWDNNDFIVFIDQFFSGC
ncbi:MAG: GC-type dockerin domain-anchored protein [Phycisphaerales bacterium]|nr:GC-type dockerin domain-anchored protein [Phycisphaerales bacterium]